MIPRALGWLLLALGVLLTATVVPGVFTTDEPNYLVTVVGLRQGRLTVPGTEGLPPSPELAFFDPTAPSRTDTATPIASTAPPLYAPIALPFSWLGWRGLVLLNTLAFLAVAWMVFCYARDHAASPQAGWLGVGAFVLGGYAIEYAQGVWPHMLSAALTMGAAYLAARARDGRRLAVAFGAGVLAGLAAGVRYQNILIVLGVGLGLLAWHPRRIAAAWRFALGAALPLAVAGMMNHARLVNQAPLVNPTPLVNEAPLVNPAPLGFSNPVSKGPGYFPSASGRGAWSLAADAARTFWVRVVDFSAALSSPNTLNETYLQRDPVTGAYLIGATLKKAWLQSAPWILLALVLLLLVWVARVGLGAGARREARALSLVVFGVLLAFAVSGPWRSDGLAFNQRYFLELVPLVAVGFAWALERIRLSWRYLLGGLLLAGLSGLAVLYEGTPSVQQYALMRAPLVLAVLLVAAWIQAPRWLATPVLAMVVGACLGWAFVVHVVDDLRGSRDLRASNLARFRALDAAIPTRAALFAVWFNKDAAGPLQLDRDVVVLDPGADDGRTAPALAAALLAGGRRVFVVGDEDSRGLFEARHGTGRARVVPESPLPLLELEAGAPGL